MGKKIGSILFAVFLALLIIAASWAIVVFMCWLISLCFGFDWTLLYATGIWLVMILVSMVFGGTGIKFNAKN